MRGGLSVQFVLVISVSWSHSRLLVCVRGLASLGAVRFRVAHHGLVREAIEILIGAISARADVKRRTIGCRLGEREGRLRGRRSEWIVLLISRSHVSTGLDFACHLLCTCQGYACTDTAKEGSAKARAAWRGRSRVHSVDHDRGKLA